MGGGENGTSPGRDTGRALLDVNEALLIAVDERPKRTPLTRLKNGGVGANADANGTPR